MMTIEYLTELRDWLLDHYAVPDDGINLLDEVQNYVRFAHYDGELWRFKAYLVKDPEAPFDGNNIATMAGAFKTLEDLFEYFGVEDDIDGL